jgi:thymidylate kinase
MAFFRIVRGPLGAGKTTVTRALATAIGAEVVHIDEIREPLGWDGGSEALFRRASRIVVERARRPLLRGRPVVVDGNFYWTSALDDLVGRRPFSSAVFPLKVPFEVCIERDRRRPLSYGEKATREVFEKVARADRGIPIDGTRRIGVIVREIRSHLPSDGPGR